MFRELASQVFGPKDFSVGLMQEVLVTLCKFGFTPDMAKSIANVKSDMAKKVVNLFPESAVAFSRGLINRMQGILSKAFNELIAVESVPVEFTEENLERWAKYNLRPIYLPDKEISEHNPPRNWRKPQQWFYDQIRNGKISKDAAQLKRGWYLADFTPSVNANYGFQVLPNDPLVSLITRLRQEGRIGKFLDTPMGSRFAITNNEWRVAVIPELAKELGLKPEQVRLERAIEFNAIGNLYDDRIRGRFDVSEQFNDLFENYSGHLTGGPWGSGGIACFSCQGSYSCRGDLAGRPLVSF